MLQGKQPEEKNQIRSLENKNKEDQDIFKKQKISRHFVIIFASLKNKKNHN